MAFFLGDILPWGILSYIGTKRKKMNHQRRQKSRSQRDLHGVMSARMKTFWKGGEASPVQH
jgi:hypothetical protein